MILAPALASAAIALAGPAPAPATLQGDLDAAAAYWQQAVPARCSTGSVSSGRLPRRVLGEATIPDPVQSGPCEMKISRGMTLRLRCLVVVHEYGHWLGHRHSSDRADPMFPQVDLRTVVPPCETPRAPPLPPDRPRTHNDRSLPLVAEGFGVLSD